MSIIAELFNMLRTKVVLDAGIYFVTSVIGAISGLLLLPILTKNLTPQDYGIVSLFGVYVFFCTTLIQFNFGTAVNRQYFDSTIDLKSYITNCFFVSSIIAVIILLMTFFFHGALSLIPEYSVLLAFGAIFSGVVGFFPAAASVLFLIKRDAKSFSLIFLLQRFADIGLALLLVVFLQKGWEGRILSSILSVCLVAIISLYLLKSELSWNINGRYMKDAILFGAPLVPLSFSNFALYSIDKLSISTMVSVHELGVYSVAIQLASVMGLLLSPIAKVWTPWAYEKMTEPDLEKKITIVKASILVFLVLTAIACVVAQVVPYLLPLVSTKAYVGAAQYMIWLLIGNVFQGLSGSIIGFQIMYFRKTGLASFLMMVISAVNVGLTLTLVSYYGAIGAAKAFFFGNLLMLIVSGYVSNRIYPLPWFFWIEGFRRRMH